MKKCFITGLAILLPTVVTLVIMIFIVNLLTKPFYGAVTSLLIHYDLLDGPIWIFQTPDVLHVLAKVIALVALFSFTILVGMLGRFLLVRYLIRLGDYIIEKIPLVNKLYKAFKDVAQTLFGDEKKAFSQVVFVPFPYADTLSVALVSNDSLPENSDAMHANLLPVFIPATPNPTMGYMLMFNREDVIFVDMKVEDAIKLIVSCGVMVADFKVAKNGA